MTTLFDAALKHLSSRHCSERELYRLLEKEFSAHPGLENAITQTLARLRELHLINDERIAESLSLRYRHKGNRFIRNVLRQKAYRMNSLRRHWHNAAMNMSELWKSYIRSSIPSTGHRMKKQSHACIHFYPVVVFRKT